MPTLTQIQAFLVAILPTLLACLGAAYVLVSILAGVLPPAWKFTQLCARLAADLRGILRLPEAPKVLFLLLVPLALAVSACDLAKPKGPMTPCDLPQTMICEEVVFVDLVAVAVCAGTPDELSRSVVTLGAQHRGVKSTRRLGGQP